METMVEFGGCYRARFGCRDPDQYTDLLKVGLPPSASPYWSGSWDTSMGGDGWFSSKCLFKTLVLCSSADISRFLVAAGTNTTSLGPFHGAIAVPSVTRCRCRRCGHRMPPAL